MVGDLLKGRHGSGVGVTRLIRCRVAAVLSLEGSPMRLSKFLDAAIPLVREGLEEEDDMDLFIAELLKDAADESE